MVSSSLCPQGLQHASLPCPLPSPRLCSNSHALSRCVVPRFSQGLSSGPVTPLSPFRHPLHPVCLCRASPVHCPHHPFQLGLHSTWVSGRTACLSLGLWQGTPANLLSCAHTSCQCTQHPTARLKVLIQSLYCNKKADHFVSASSLLGRQTSPS